MSKIYSKNKEYYGTSATVKFIKGVGETSDSYLIKWFKNHGYDIEENVEVKNIDNNKTTKKANSNVIVNDISQETKSDDDNITNSSGIEDNKTNSSEEVSEPKENKILTEQK